MGLQHRVKLYPILNRWFDMPLPAVEYQQPASEADLMALTPKVAAERKPKSVSAIVYKIAANAAAAGTRITQLSLGIRAARESAYFSEGETRGYRSCARGSRANHVDEAVIGLFGRGRHTRYRSGYQRPAVFNQTSSLLRASACRVVLAFAQGGKEAFLTQRRGIIAALLEKGVAVCLADVRGTGETADGVNSVVGREAMNAPSASASGNGINAGDNRAGAAFERCSHGGALPDEP